MSDEDEEGSFSMERFVQAHVDMDKYLEEARQLFVTGGRGGRDGVIRYLSGAIAIIRSDDIHDARDLTPLYVLQRALKNLDDNIVHPMLKPEPGTGRPKDSDLRNFIKAYSVWTADWLHGNGSKRSEADQLVAKELEGLLPTEHSDDRITADTIRNWRAAINKADDSDFTRTKHRSFTEDPPTPSSGQNEPWPPSKMLSTFAAIVKGYRPGDI